MTQEKVQFSCDTESGISDAQMRNVMGNAEPDLHKFKLPTEYHSPEPAFSNVIDLEFDFSLVFLLGESNQFSFISDRTKSCF